jgi:hypothetical protein
VLIKILVEVYFQMSASKRRRLSLNMLDFQIDCLESKVICLELQMSIQWRA